MSTNTETKAGHQFTREEMDKLLHILGSKKIEEITGYVAQAPQPQPQDNQKK